MSGEQETRLAYIHESMYTLRDLLQRLYPDEPSPDILTLDDFLYRFRLKESSPRAINAIKQSQRINRAIGNHRQTGLCEFHVGLIYLHWGDCLGACQQFAEARRHWSFVDEAGSVCLAHFAEGLAYYHAYHYEAAMTSFGKAEQLLPRIPLASPSDTWGAFVLEIGERLKTAQELTRQAMWVLREEPALSPPEQATPVQETPTPALETAVPPLPIFVPPPEVNPNPTPEEQWYSPIPGHEKVETGYEWYEVELSNSQVYPAVQKGDWILVQAQSSNYQPGELVMVSIDSEINDGMLVKPQTEQRPFRRIYLIQSEELIGTFTRDINGKIILSPHWQQISVDFADILGVVRGFWQRITRSDVHG